MSLIIVNKICSNLVQHEAILFQTGIELGIHKSLLQDNHMGKKLIQSGCFMIICLLGWGANTCTLDRKQNNIDNLGGTEFQTYDLQFSSKGFSVKSRRSW